MKSPSMPAAPDPVATANAQAKANSNAAQTQQQLNMVNQVTPYGNLTYSQTGTTMGPNGKPLPQYTATTTLSPEEQRNQNQQWEYDNLVNTLGINQTKKLTGILDTPFKLDNAATEGRLAELGRARLDPMLEQRRAALENRLYNQGVLPGTEAYRRAMEADTQGANDAYNQLFLTGRAQANQELLTERNQPINETTALMSGGQVQQPSFTGTPTASVAAPDVGGLTMDAYRYGPLAAYNAANANYQGMLGAIGSMAGTGARVAMGGWGRTA